MFSKVSGLGVVLVLLAGTFLVGPAEAVGRYTPRTGVVFNNPMVPGGANRIVSHVRRSIDAAPRNSIIRIAAYSFDRRDVADALLRACRNRNVTVQIVLNDNFVSRPTRRMRRVLGRSMKPRWNDACHKVRKPKNPRKHPEIRPYQEPSYVRICHAACRMGGEFGNQHMKFYLFSKAGKAKNVVMFGSANLTGYAAHVHWNDLFTARSRSLFDSYSKIFHELARDKRIKKTYRVYQSRDLVTEFGAKRNAKGARDPIMRRLAQVSCAAKSGTGVSGRTAIRISMYGWRGSRGLYLARRVADLSRAGCNIAVLVSGASGPVLGALRAGGVRMRSASLDLDDDKLTGFEETGWEHFTHEKWMSLNGTWAGKGQRVVWTGSENWSRVSFLNDEMTVKIPRAGVYTSYVQHFDYLWANWSRPL